MIKFKPALLTATFALALAACGQKEEPAAEVAATESAQSLLSLVPTDTPYVAASLSPPPDAVIDTYLKRWEPVLTEMQNQLVLARSELEADGGSDQNMKLLLALLNEFDGKFNRAGLESLGIDLAADRVIYGMGAFPVIRLGLSSPETLRATIQRVFDNGEMEVPEQDYQGLNYWRLDDHDQGEVPIALYIAILNDHLSMAVFPSSAEAELLPAFLALEKPSESDALERLVAINREHGYTPYGTGYLDLHRMAERFLDPEALLARTLAAHGEFDAATLGATCNSEIHGIIDNMPMMTAGVTELTGDTVAYQYRLQHPNTLASQLQALVPALPALSGAADRVMEFAFGIKIGAAREFLREKATAIVDAPYQCEELEELNQSAQNLLTQLDQPIPPFVNNFRAVRVSLTEIMTQPNSMVPNNARGHLAVHVEQPQMFVGMAQMFLPDLSEMAMMPGDPPMQLPESLVPVSGAVAFAAMSDDAIGLSVGEGEETGLPAFLAAKAGPKGTFMDVDYDMQAYMTYSDNLQNAIDIQVQQDGEHAGLKAYQAISDAAQDVIKETSDRNKVSMRLTAEGLVIDGRSTFK